MGYELAQFATSILTAFYGAASPQMKHFQTGVEAIQHVAQGTGWLHIALRIRAR